MLSFLFLLLLPLLNPATSQQLPAWTLIDCGSDHPSLIGDRQWLPDTAFVSTGTSKTSQTVSDVVLSTARTFPLRGNVNRKFCYEVPVVRTRKYLVRSTYFYGQINGNLLPPVFDQIVDGTLWSSVNTTDDYRNNLASYYEGIFVAGAKNMSVCLAANDLTDSDPFISALELIPLADSLYNSTDFGSFGLRLIARNSFGYNGPFIRFPDDVYDRIWVPFGQSNDTIPSFRNVSVSGFWNNPPLKVFQTDLSSSEPRSIGLSWPPMSLPKTMNPTSYYIALYFASNLGNSRMFTITVNDIVYYQNLNVTSEGSVVFANQWPLEGITNITLTPANGSTIGPLINAGEVFEILPLKRTLTRDATAMEQIKSRLQNPPVDWNGDPCLPLNYGWSGVTCSNGTRIRVTALNLTNMGLLGSIPPEIANLTALSDIWLGNNSLSGTIPDVSSLKLLKTLHLEFNQLTGEIPPSLGNIGSLNELFLQGNNLIGQVPRNLVSRPGLNLKIFPGNPLLVPPQ